MGPRARGRGARTGPAGTGRRRPLAAGAVYHAPPPDKDDVGIDAEDLLVVDCRDRFSETVFTGFLDRLTERLQALTP